MSSDKLRLKLRVKRLQTMYSQLGRDPNAKEYEIKSLTMDFDKVMRKQLARLKKGRYQRLKTRQHILLAYGFKIKGKNKGQAIDEEVNSIMNVFEADQKRLKSILQTYEEKKTDLLEREKKERLEVIQMAKDCFSLFKLEYNDQTNKFEKGQVYNLDASINMKALDMTNTSRIDSATNLSRANLNKNMHIYPHDNEKNETVSAFMMDDARDIRLKHESQHDFDTVLNKIVKKLERIEKEFVLGDFDGAIQINLQTIILQEEVILDSYNQKFDNFYETVTNIRSVKHAYFDICLIISIMVLITLALYILKTKGIIQNYHWTTIRTY